MGAGACSAPHSGPPGCPARPDGCDALVDPRPQSLAAGAPSGLYVAQGHGAIRVLRVDRPAQEAIPVVDPDLGHVAWIVTDGDAFAHEGGERGIEIAQAAEADAVAPDHAWSSDQNEELVEILEPVGHVRQPAIRDPAARIGLTPVAGWGRAL